MKGYTAWQDAIGFETCADDECEGRIGSHGKCRRCGKTPDEIEEEREAAAAAEAAADAAGSDDDNG